MSNTVEEMRTTTREWKVVKQALAWIAGTALLGAGTGAVALYQSGRNDGAKDERLQQLERRVEKLSNEHDWLVKTLFRVPALPPAGGVP